MRRHTPLEFHRVRKGQRMAALGIGPLALAAWALGLVGFVGLTMIWYGLRGAGKH